MPCKRLAIRTRLSFCQATEKAGELSEPQGEFSPAGRLTKGSGRQAFAGHDKDVAKLKNHQPALAQAKNQ